MDIDTIYNMDCLVGMNDIPDRSVDMILCDLPYGTTHNHWDSVIPLDRLWEQYKRVLKKGGVVCLTAQIPFSIDLAQSNRDWLRYEWIWEKNNATGFLNANRAPMKIHENVLVFYESLGTYNPQGLKYGKKSLPGYDSPCYNLGYSQASYRENIRENPNSYSIFSDGIYSGLKNYPKDIIRISYDTDKIHPTQKPVALFEYLIRTYTNEGETVLDNCMGSGTTAVACIRSKRHYIGYELSEQYYNIAMERIAEERKKITRRDLYDF